MPAGSGWGVGGCHRGELHEADGRGQQGQELLGHRGIVGRNCDALTLQQHPERGGEHRLQSVRFFRRGAGGGGARTDSRSTGGRVPRIFRLPGCRGGGGGAPAPSLGQDGLPDLVVACAGGSGVEYAAPASVVAGPRTLVIVGNAGMHVVVRVSVVASICRVHARRED